MRLVIATILALLAVFAGFIGLVAWSDGQHVCPEGNQCSDAVMTMLACATLAIVLLAGSFVLARSRRRKD